MLKKYSDIIITYWQQQNQVDQRSKLFFGVNPKLATQTLKTDFIKRETETFVSFLPKTSLANAGLVLGL
jgi:hypothetical protein